MTSMPSTPPPMVGGGSGGCISADGEPGAALEILRRYLVTHVLVRREGNRVHPAVLERLTLLMRAGDVSLYGVPEEIRR